MKISNTAHYWTEFFISTCIIHFFRISSLIFGRIFKFTHRFPGLFSLTPSGRRHWRLKRKLHKFTANVIASRRLKIASDSYNPEQKLNFMDMLLHTRVDGKPLSDEDIREEVDTFMFEVFNSLIFQRRIIDIICSGWNKTSFKLTYSLSVSLCFSLRDENY